MVALIVSLQDTFLVITQSSNLCNTKALTLFTTLKPLRLKECMYSLCKFCNPAILISNSEIDHQVAITHRQHITTSPPTPRTMATITNGRLVPSRSTILSEHLCHCCDVIIRCSPIINESGLAHHPHYPRHQPRVILRVLYSYRPYHSLMIQSCG